MGCRCCCVSAYALQYMVLLGMVAVLALEITAHYIPLTQFSVMVDGIYTLALYYVWYYKLTDSEFPSSHHYYTSSMALASRILLEVSMGFGLLAIACHIASLLKQRRVQGGAGPLAQRDLRSIGVLLAMACAFIVLCSATVLTMIILYNIDFFTRNKIPPELGLMAEDDGVSISTNAQWRAGLRLCVAAFLCSAVMAPTLWVLRFLTLRKVSTAAQRYVADCHEHEMEEDEEDDDHQDVRRGGDGEFPPPPPNIRPSTAWAPPHSGERYPGDGHSGWSTAKESPPRDYSLQAQFKTAA